MDEREKLITEVAKKLSDNNVKFVLLTVNEEGTTSSVNASMRELLECFNELIGLMLESCEGVHIPKLEVATRLEDCLFQALVECVSRETTKQEDQNAD